MLLIVCTHPLLSGILYRHSAVLMINLIDLCLAACPLKGPGFSTLRCQAQDVSTVMFVKTYPSDVEGLLGYRARNKDKKRFFFNRELSLYQVYTNI